MPLCTGWKKKGSLPRKWAAPQPSGAAGGSGFSALPTTATAHCRRSTRSASNYGRPFQPKSSNHGSAFHDMENNPQPHRPPGWIDRLLTVLIAPHFLEDILGDLHEVYAQQ